MPVRGRYAVPSGRLAVALALGALLGLPAGVAAQKPPRVQSYRLDLTPAEIAEARARQARAIAAPTYLLGLPAFMNLAQSASYRAARVMLAPDEEPFGGWLLIRDLSTPATTTVMPNVDTLYGAAFARLELQGPVVLSMPAVADGRYVSVALLDAYFSSVEVFGPRTTGGRGQPCPDRPSRLGRGEPAGHRPRRGLADGFGHAVPARLSARRGGPAGRARDPGRDRSRATRPLARRGSAIPAHRDPSAGPGDTAWPARSAPLLRACRGPWTALNAAAGGLSRAERDG